MPAKVNVSGETVRKWVRQAEVDAGTSSADAAELTRLRRGNKELRRANGILMAAWRVRRIGCRWRTSRTWPPGPAPCTSPRQGATLPVVTTISVLNREMFSEAEAARLLQVSQSTLNYWLEGGERRGKTSSLRRRQAAPA